MNPASWHSALLGKGSPVAFLCSSPSSKDLHPRCCPRVTRENRTSIWAAENMRDLLTSHLHHSVMSRKAKQLWEAVLVMPARGLTTCAIFRKLMCLCFLFPSSAVTAPAVLMLSHSYKVLQTLWRSPALLLSIATML